MELGSMSDAFPNGSFPVGAVHEFLSDRVEDAAATSGFVGGLISGLMKRKGIGLWISASRTLFPPALKMLGIDPERFIFLDLKKEKDVLWVMDEALKCAALKTVVGELRNIDFTESRRLQLAVEQSQVTGFVLRHQSRNPGTTACVSRWKISSLPSTIKDDLPGIGHPGWKVELLRMRNGKPGTWNIQWQNGAFVPVQGTPLLLEVQQKKTG
jgi:protein ImuA